MLSSHFTVHIVTFRKYYLIELNDTKYQNFIKINICGQISSNKSLHKTKNYMALKVFYKAKAHCVLKFQVVIQKRASEEVVYKKGFSDSKEIE